MTEPNKVTQVGLSLPCPTSTQRHRSGTLAQSQAYQCLEGGARVPCPREARGPPA